MFVWDIVLKDICSKYKDIKEKIKSGYNDPDIILVYRDQLIEDMNRLTNVYKSIRSKIGCMKFEKGDMRDEQKKLFTEMIECRVEYECISLCLHYINRTLNDELFEVEMKKIYNDMIMKKYIEIFKRMEVD